MRWKLTLQLAPARDGMNLSPCLLGDDRGEFVGVKERMTSVTLCSKHTISASQLIQISPERKHGKSNSTYDGTARVVILDVDLS